MLVGRFKEMPRNKNSPSLNEDELNKIMLIALPISKETILMIIDNTNLSGSLNFKIIFQYQ
ncbi:hypothetical protein V3Q90_15055 [Flavobacterium oreochromis]|nr:hypothetical protein [Flavobacterium oreochromis]OWP77744.1 hypothetical protein BWG23_04085 [Flavobacterium oreochromis]QYS85767.1 hypothetical protein JJC03_11505 [Flavobacterium oreochromis]